MGWYFFQCVVVVRTCGGQAGQRYPRPGGRTGTAVAVGLGRSRVDRVGLLKPRSKCGCGRRLGEV
jgi:hypothetical protein